MAKGIAVCALLTWYGWQTVNYLPAWRSDVALWTHAHQMVPMKPRVAMNYGLMLLSQGELEAGLAQLGRAQALTHQAHVPTYDVAMTRARVETNLRRLFEAAQ